MINKVMYGMFGLNMFFAGMNAVAGHNVAMAISLAAATFIGVMNYKTIKLEGHLEGFEEFRKIHDE